MAKSGNFENRSGRRLSLLWSGGKRKDLVSRTRNSGGYFTYQTKLGTKVTFLEAGDLRPADPDIVDLFRVFSFECKIGYARLLKQSQLRVNWGILDLADDRKSLENSTFMQMWTQCSRDANETNRLPFLIFQRPFKYMCVAFPRWVMKQLQDVAGKPDFCLLSVDLDYIEGGSIAIMGMDEFERWVSCSLQLWVRSRLNRRTLIR